MSFLRFIKKYFSFSIKERNGLLVLSTIIIVLAISAYLIKNKTEKISIEITPLSYAPTDSLRSTFSTKKTFVKRASQQFAFDPNEITAAQALLLGFSKKTTQVLLNYRKKGGAFKTKEDLKKIYGVSASLYTELEPYIIIKSAIINPDPNNIVQKLKSTFSLSSINLNAADSEHLVSVRGIGPVLSKRILRYRNALGGFYSVQQLKEVYGISDSVFSTIIPQFSIDTLVIKKINLNTAGIDELRQHPYFKFIIAQSIINYRKQHGHLKHSDELKQIGSISDELLKKITPYICF